MLARLAATAPLMLVVLLVGCEPRQQGPTLDAAQTAEIRKAILAEAEPTGAVTPEELREEEGGFAGGDVVLVGRVGGIPNPWKDIETSFPWRTGEATFFLVDPAAADAFADHSADDPDHAENCPFCASGAGDNADAVAVVTFTDADGKTYPQGAAELLELKEGATVVVSGAANVDGDVLIVKAKNLYIRQ